MERLDREGGRFSALLMGVIESAPFQKRRSVSAVAAESTRLRENSVFRARVEAMKQDHPHNDLSPPSGMTV